MSDSLDENWIRVCETRELAPGEHRVVEGPDDDILVVNADGVILAVIDECSHQELPISDGPIDGDIITCPWHNAEFCLRDGEALSAPAYEPIDCYDVRVENDTIYVSSQPREAG
ncbi:MAG: Rieske (2Fe-2S) protein [Pseudomonadota bacterium]